MTLIVESTSIKRLQDALSSEAHAILLSGPIGVGLKTIAAQLTSPTILVQPELKTSASTIAQISVERIRKLYDETRTKSATLQTVLIDDIDAMSLPAQNSFLKLLEEPGSSIRFIVTSHHPERLLPTIRSRLQHVVIGVDTTLTESLVGEIADVQKKRQLNFLAAGLPAEIYRLMNDEMYFRNTIFEVTLAKKIVEASVYERLVLLSKEKIDRSSALRILERALLFQQMSSVNKQSAYRQRRLLAAYESIEQNGNVKLQLAFAMV